MKSCYTWTNVTRLVNKNLLVKILINEITTIKKKFMWKKIELEIKVFINLIKISRVMRHVLRNESYQI